MGVVFGHPLQGILENHESRHDKCFLDPTCLHTCSRATLGTDKGIQGLSHPTEGSPGRQFFLPHTAVEGSAKKGNLCIILPPAHDLCRLVFSQTCLCPLFLTCGRSPEGLCLCLSLCSERREELDLSLISMFTTIAG